MSKQNDEVILVDQHDNQIGVMNKIEAHRGNGKRHRAVSVYLFNTKGELLIQKRSAEKIVGTRQWANTCCGNVWPNESREACARRRLSFELGITGVSLTPLYTFEYHLPINTEFSEWEIDEVFVGRYGRVCTPNPDEAAEWRWISKEMLKQEMQDHTTEFAAWFLLMMKDGRVLEYWDKTFV